MIPCMRVDGTRSMRWVRKVGHSCSQPNARKLEVPPFRHYQGVRIKKHRKGGDYHMTAEQIDLASKIRSLKIVFSDTECDKIPPEKACITNFMTIMSGPVHWRISMLSGPSSARRKALPLRHCSVSGSAGTSTWPERIWQRGGLTRSTISGSKHTCSGSSGRTRSPQRSCARSGFFSGSPLDMRSDTS